MALLDTAVRTAANRMPKVISPKTHAIIDYATAGAFFLAGALMWRRHKRAAISSFICGAAETATAMMTDYPGGVTPVIDFETHGKMDAGLSALTATMPTLMAFGDDREAMFFRGQAVGMAAVTGLTDFEDTRSLRGRRAA
jgi:hypothetical protein